MATNSRFQSVSENDIQDILNGKNSKSTQRTIKKATNTFRTVLVENGNNKEFENFDKKILNDHLRIFFASIKKQGRSREKMEDCTRKMRTSTSDMDCQKHQDRDGLGYQ